MNAAITLPRGLRHPSWYIPLLLPILPLFGAYIVNDSHQLACLLGAIAMLALGLFYSLGLGAWLDHAPRLIRKEVEQLRPAWLVGLFGAQCGLLYRDGNSLDGVLVIPPLMYVLLAALSFGIEFQQRTMPSLLCAPIDRARLWRVKMGVLAGAILSQVLVLAVSAATAQAAQDSSLGNASGNTLILVGYALAFAAAAWATVPLWTLLTRNLLAGLVFAIAVPPFPIVLIGSLTAWMASPFAFMSDLGSVVIGTLTGAYLLAAPWLAWRQWLTLEAPDSPEREMSGLFLGKRQTSGTQRTTTGSWFQALISKELRLQTVTLICLGMAALLTMTQPYLPASLFSQELASLLIGMFAVLSILLAGSTAIAEERRLGTLDPQVLLPVSRTIQWSLKLAVGFAIAGTAVGLVGLLLPASARSIETSLPLGSVLILFVFSFLASSAAPNSLRALILGIAFTAVIVGVCYLVVAVGMTGTFFRTESRFAEAMDQPEPWLAHARALSEAEASALDTPIIPQFLPTLITVGLAAASMPLILALAFSRHNFAHPSAASRRIPLQFPLCVLATLVAGVTVVGGALWLTYREHERNILRLAHKEVKLVDRLSPAELQLHRTLRQRPLNETPELIPVRRRLPPRGMAPALPATPTPAEPSSSTSTRLQQGLHWVTEFHRLPFTPQARAIVLHDGDIAEDLREVLRQEAIAKGDPDVPAAPGRPPGPWPETGATGVFQMSPEMMRRYGLSPQGGKAALSNATRTNTPSAVEDSNPLHGTAPQPISMSPELMKRYGLTPPPAPPTSASSPTSAPATSNPPPP